MVLQLTCSQGHRWELKPHEMMLAVSSCPQCQEVVVLPSVTIRAELPPPREARFDGARGESGVPRDFRFDQVVAELAPAKESRFEKLLAELGEPREAPAEEKSGKISDGQSTVDVDVVLIEKKPPEYAPAEESEIDAPPQREWWWVGAGVGVLLLIVLIIWMVSRGGSTIEIAAKELERADNARRAARGEVNPQAPIGNNGMALAGSGALQLRASKVEPLDKGAIKVTYIIENKLDQPLSVALRDGDYYVGRRTHMLERIGADWRIKALEKDCDVADTRYVLSSRPTWSEPVIGPRQSMQFSITLDAGALEKGTYRYWVQFKSVDNGAANEQYAQFEWAGGGNDANAASPAVSSESPSAQPSAGLPLKTAPEPTPSPAAPNSGAVIPDPEPSKVGLPDAPPKGVAMTREQEINRAWRDAEIDTIHMGMLERDRNILAKMRSASELLLSRNGRIDPRADNSGGVPVLNIYALLHAAQAIDDPRLKFSSPEMTWTTSDLVRLDTKATYVTSLQTSALSMLPKRDVVIEALKRNQLSLLSPNPDGSYTYELSPARFGSPGARQTAAFDHSNTQYGNLGALALMDADMEVSNAYWQIASSHWRQTQCSDGGWDYGSGKGSSTGTMTEAGLTALLSASYAEMSMQSPYRDNAIVRGFRAMDKHLDNGDVYTSHNGYGLYGIERVGLTSGLKRIGGHEWYSEGLLTLDKALRVNRNRNSVDTAFQLLFMTRGRNPVVMNKLQYGGAWDYHPWDLAYLTRWLSKTFERPLIWQVIASQDPVDDWMDAPILLISGDKAFTVSEQLLGKMRAYVDAGGTILSVATRDSPAFTQFVRNLANRLTHGTYEMRKLDDKDPFHSLYRKSENPPETWGMSNGVREIWIHSPKDIGRDWARNAQAQSASWDTAVNAYLYVNGKSPMKRRIFLTDPRSTVVANYTKRVIVGRFNYAGNWNPEPGAWPLAAIWMARYGIQVQIVEVNAANLMRVKPDMLSITGTTTIRPTKEMQDAINAYVAAGGTVLAEAAGGRSEFSESFMLMMKNSLDPIPMGDPLFDMKIGNRTLADNIEYRRSWILKYGQISGARLRGAKSGADRYSVILSPDDITSGFLGTNTWGVLGYAPETSRQMLRAILEQVAANNNAAKAPKDAAK